MMDVSITNISCLFLVSYNYKMFFKVILAILFFYFNKVESGGNSCVDWVSYIFNPKLSPRCYYNPDVEINTIEIIERYLGIGSYENHTVTTEDGYILTMFRILQNNPKGVVMLQHPFTVDSVTWLQDGSNRSMAFNLHNMGYEVWLPNHRGTDYSEKHVNLTINDLEYWQFSFHEIAIYDYPAFVEKISEVSNRTDIIFVGNSMSSTSGIIYASMLPDHAKKYLKVMILVNPVTILKHLKGFGTILALIMPFVRDTAYSLGIGGLFNNGSISRKFAKSGSYSPLKPLFILMSSILNGPSSFDPRLATFVLAQLPRGSSLNTYNHFSQLYTNGGNFRMYDFGRDENLKRYNLTIPPEYPLENIKMPIYIICSKDDYIATIEDNDILYSRLPDMAKVYGKFYTSKMDHIDFFYGKNRYEFAVNHVLEFIERISEK